MRCPFVKDQNHEVISLILIDIYFYYLLPMWVHLIKSERPKNSTKRFYRIQNKTFEQIFLTIRPHFVFVMGEKNDHPTCSSSKFCKGAWWKFRYPSQIQIHWTWNPNILFILSRINWKPWFIMNFMNKLLPGRLDQSWAFNHVDQRNEWNIPETGLTQNKSEEWTVTIISKIWPIKP